MAAKQLPSLYDIAEEIDNLKRTNQFSVVKVFVEGPDDVKIFNSIVKHKDLGERVEVSNRGGRTALLELQEAYLLQKSQIRRQVVFFADQDTWVFTGIPEKYEEVHFTKGYSIENDLFEDGQQAMLSHLYTVEKERFTQLIESVCTWFAHEVQLIIEGKGDAAKFDKSLLDPNVIAPHANRMAIPPVDSITSEQEEQIKSVKQNYVQLLRGKFLFELFQRLSIDRGGHKENLPIPNESSLFSTCIAEGLRSSTSNSTRIATLLQNTLNSTPPTF